jgi:hypothetical protein
MNKSMEIDLLTYIYAPPSTTDIKYMEKYGKIVCFMFLMVKAFLNGWIAYMQLK